jgi:hypothetical protein
MSRHSDARAEERGVTRLRNNVVARKISLCEKRIGSEISLSTLSTVLLRVQRKLTYSTIVHQRRGLRQVDQLRSRWWPLRFKEFVAMSVSGGDGTGRSDWFWWQKPSMGTV